jgi:hypothetical protein
VKAKDIDDVESPWSDTRLGIVPKSKTYDDQNYLFLRHIIDFFSILEKKINNNIFGS